MININSREIVPSTSHTSNVNSNEILITKDKILKIGIAILGGGISFCYPAATPLVGATIYLITSHLFSNRDFEIICEKDLGTKVGKIKYLEFLKTNSNETPSVKLFGKKAEVKTTSESRKHIHSLMLKIHPDRVPSEEQLLCTEISKHVNIAAEEYLKPQKLDPLSACFGMVNDQFDIFLKSGQWVLAKKFIKDNSPYACLFDIREGNFQRAIQSASSSGIFIDIVSVLQTCQNMDVSLQELLQSLQKIQALRDIFCVRLKLSSLPDIVPHCLYLSIAECYKESPKHAVEYQQYLRLAIRSCLSPEIKKQLVEELKRHLFCFQKAPKINQEMRIFEEIGSICESFKKKILETLDTAHSKKLIDLLDAYLGNRTPDKLQNIIDETEKFLQKEYFGSSFVPSFFKGYADHYLAYTDEQLKELTHGHNLLQGVKSFLNGKEDFRDAVIYFEKSNHHLFHALSKLGLKNFQGALASLSKLSLEDAFVEECFFEVMNIHDTCLDALHVPTHFLLLEINDFQFSILKDRINTETLK